MRVETAMLAAAIVSSGLMAGLFFGWAVSVMPGLSSVDSPTYISTMQNINQDIINVPFVGTFMLTPLVLAAAAVLQYRTGDTRRAWLLAAAAATYVVGVLGVTSGGNIPLNNELDGFDLGALADQADLRRSSYETGWNRWHYGRTAASIAAFGLSVTTALVSAEA